MPPANVAACGARSPIYICTTSIQWWPKSVILPPLNSRKERKLKYIPDAVGVGDPKEWAWDPYQGKVEDGYVYGRGSCDQRAGMASMVYAGKMIKQVGLLGDYTLWVVGSVQEEDCDGLCWLYILREDGMRPDCVVITEPSKLGIR